MENPKERRKEKQLELIEKAKKIIWDNLLKTGIAKRVIEQSLHATKLDGGFVYNNIRFWPEMGSNHLAITPRMETKNRSTQSVTLKLERIVTKEEGAEELAKMIWQNVSEEMRIAIATWGIKYWKERQLSTIKDHARIAEDDPKAAKRAVSDAQRDVAILKMLTEALEHGHANLSLDHLAALVIRE